MKKPVGCTRTERVAATCSRCGMRPQVVHIPSRSLELLCGGCCPDCAKANKADLNAQVEASA